MTGTDIIEIDRIAEAIKSQRFLERVFLPEERAYIESKGNPAQTAAGIFCIKEAVSKALGTGIANGVAFTEIRVDHDGYGKPFIKFYGKTKELFDQKKYREAGVSVSHCKSYAVAFCVLL